MLSNDVQPQQVGELFESFTLLWQEARICIDTIEFSKAIVWKDLVPEGFEETAVKLMSKVGCVPLRNSKHETKDPFRARSEVTFLSHWFQATTCCVPYVVLLQVKKLPKNLHDTDAYKGLFAHVKNFMSVCPLVGSLKRSKLSSRHWEELLGASNADNAGFSVHDVDETLRLEVCLASARTGSACSYIYLQRKLCRLRRCIACSRVCYRRSFWPVFGRL